MTDQRVKTDTESKVIVLFYDGDCGFCQSSRDWLADHSASGTLITVPYQYPQLAEEYPMIDRSHADKGVQVLFPDGKVINDQDAIAACLKQLPAKYRGWIWLAHLITFVLFRPFCIVGYRIVAANRRRISILLGKPACALPVKAEV